VAASSPTSRASKDFLGGHGPSRWPAPENGHHRPADGQKMSGLGGEDASQPKPSNAGPPARLHILEKMLEGNRGSPREIPLAACPRLLSFRIDPS